MVCEAKCLGCYLILQVKSCRFRKLLELAKGPIRQNDAVSSQFDLHDKVKVRLVVYRSASRPAFTAANESHTSWCCVPVIIRLSSYSSSSAQMHPLVKT